MQKLEFPPKPTNPLFVYNPAAGIKNKDFVLRLYKKVCQQNGWKGCIHETKEGEDITRVVSKYIEQGCDVVLAGGGDGTISSVVTSLIGTNIPMAIIPLGTGNLLARLLKIPLQTELAFNYINQHTSVKFLNALHLKNRYAVLNGSVGFSSDLIKSTSRQEKRRFGMFAYLWRGLQIIIGIQPHKFGLVIDGKTFTVRASEIYVTNPTVLIEEIFLNNLPPDALDSPFVAFIVKARTLRDYVGLVLDILLGRINQSPRMTCMLVKNSIKISTKRPITVQADGEVIGQTPVTIDVIRNAVKLIIPNSNSK